MSSTTYYLVALFMGGVLVWQIVSGPAMGAWWYPSITRQDRRGPVEGLNLALLVHAQHQRPVRRIQVETHYVANLLLQLGVVG